MAPKIKRTDGRNDFLIKIRMPSANIRKAAIDWQNQGSIQMFKTDEMLIPKSGIEKSLVVR